MIAELARWSTPSVVNGLKRLGVHPSRIASADRRAVASVSPGLGVSVGYAVTRRVRTRRDGSAPDASRMLAGHDIAAGASPGFLVIEDVGDPGGPVCLIGELVATISAAHGCRAGLTNGAVRDVAEMESLGFQAFAGGVAVGGGYVDLVEAGGTVSVGGLTVRPGDLLHGDRHGVVVVPAGHAARLPEAMASHAHYERSILDACRAPFDPARLDEALGIPQ